MAAAGLPGQAARSGYPRLFRHLAHPPGFFDLDQDLTATLDESLMSRRIAEDREVPALRSPPRRKGQIHDNPNPIP